MTLQITSDRNRRKKPKGPAYTPKTVKPYVKPEPRKLQPRWKWSYNGHTDRLKVWPTDKWGDPHHVEVTGPNYYNYCQGRIYVYGNGDRETIAPDEEVEVMVWKDRGPEEWQPPAVEKVKEWVQDNFNEEVDKVIYRQEYAYYKQPAVNHQDLEDYYNHIKNTDEDYLAEQYAQAVDLDGGDEDELYEQYSKPIDWEGVENTPMPTKTKYWMWMYDGTDFNARQTDSPTPNALDYEEKFGDDGTWSSQGMLEVRDNKYVTMIIDTKKPYAFQDHLVDLKKEQNGAYDSGISWIKTILGGTLDHVKYAKAK